DREKGAGVVIDSLPIVLRVFPDATLDVVGDGDDLPLMRRRVAELGLNGCVTLHGKVPHSDVIRLMRGADPFCYPTAASEGSPKAVVEARACGLPVIATLVSVIPELIASGGGALLDERTPEALATAVQECLGRADRYRAMSAAALATARGYSLERWRD